VVEALSLLGKAFIFIRKLQIAATQIFEAGRSRQLFQSGRFGAVEGRRMDRTAGEIQGVPPCAAVGGGATTAGVSLR
jgi:hypothetical protein